MNDINNVTEKHRTPLQRLVERQTRRIDLLWTRFESTGEDRWLDAALAADRVYLRMREMAQ